MAFFWELLAWILVPSLQPDCTFLCWWTCLKWLSISACCKESPWACWWGVLWVGDVCLQELPLVLVWLKGISGSREPQGAGLERSWGARVSSQPWKQSWLPWGLRAVSLLLSRGVGGRRRGLLTYSSSSKVMFVLHDQDKTGIHSYSIC